MLSLPWLLRTVPRFADGFGGHSKQSAPLLDESNLGDRSLNYGITNT